MQFPGKAGIGATGWKQRYVKCSMKLYGVLKN